MHLAYAFAVLLAVTPVHAQSPVIAAAANIQFALDEIVAAFRRETGQPVRVSYGATGNLVQQIENGAPFELLLAADESAIDRLAKRGHARDGGVVYATGRLALYLPAGSPLALDPTLADLRAAAADGRLKRFALANPEHAPYGRAAQQALERAGAWHALRPRLVVGESVTQAMQFAAGGDSQGGLVPLALAVAPRFAAAGRHVVLPESAHDPLRQRMALLRTAGPVSERLYAFLRSPAARATFERHGYTVPEGG